MSTQASSISMVRHCDDGNSVLVAYTHHDVQVRSFVDAVLIGFGTEIIARHRRFLDTADMVFDLLHCQPLLGQRVGLWGHVRQGGGNCEMA